MNPMATEYRNPVLMAFVFALVAVGVALFLVCGVLAMRRAMPSPSGLTAHQSAIVGMNGEIAGEGKH